MSIRRLRTPRLRPPDIDEFEHYPSPLVPQSAVVIMIMGLAAALGLAIAAVLAVVKVLIVACQYGCPT